MNAPFHRHDILETLCSLASVPRERVSPGAKIRDLVPDSFALVEMVIDLQDELGLHLSFEDFVGVETVDDLLALCERGGMARAG